MNDSVYVPKSSASNPDLEFLDSLFSTPCLPATKSQIEQRASTVEGNASAGTSILVIDELRSGQHLTGFLLKKLGYEVELVDHSAAAIGALWRRSYALIFLELNLPLTDAYRTAAIINQVERSQGRKTPIIGMSFDQDPVERAQCLSSGMVDYIYKGDLSEIIVDVLTKWCLPDRLKVQPVSTEPEAAPFDLAECQLIYGMAEVERLVPLFVGAAKTLLSCLNLAIENKDSAGLKLFAESLGEQAARFKLSRIVEISGSMALKSSEGNWQVLDELLSELNFRWTLVFDYLHGRFGNL